jgi:glutathione S-transferase
MLQFFIKAEYCVVFYNADCLYHSHAILGYLVLQYAKDDSLYAKEPKKRALIDQRLHFDTGVFFPRLGGYFVSSVQTSYLSKYL